MTLSLTLSLTLGYKDRNITWRHMANQISCYEIKALPGTAFDYNDWRDSSLSLSLSCPPPPAPSR